MAIHMLDHSLPGTIAAMSSNDVFVRALETIQRRFHLTLEGITREQLIYRPHPETNSIAWLGWHLTRWQDTQVSRFAGQKQAWVDAWAAKFGLEPDPDNTGIGHTNQQVAAMQPSAQLLRDYHDAIYARSVAYLSSGADLERQVDNPHTGATDSISGRLVGVLSDNFQHVGQMAYLRGLLAENHWGAH